MNKDSEKSVKQNINKRKAPKSAFKPGQSGNPNGRPKKEFCIPDILRELASQPSSFDPTGKMTRLQRICKKALELAEGGDKDARNWIADRMEGKAIDRIISRNADNDEIVIE